MTISASRTDLEKLVKNFGPFRKQNKVLEEQRLFILELRARGGSYPQIRQLLATVGFDVSDASLSKFCCKHQPEIERLRIQMEDGISPAPAQRPFQPTSSSLNSTPTQITTLLPQKKSRDLRGPV